ncbi:MAG: T9SS type A sorting domain-containing protein [Ignavibacteriales bacterium]|nr:T9SS type A sorting domain-containing protein [Ignavibacteriales bacterium]
MGKRLAAYGAAFAAVIAVVVAFEAGVPTATDSEEENVPGFVPADEWFATQRAYPFDDIPEDLRRASVERAIKAERGLAKRATSLNWSLVGPTNIEGRITAIAIHPTEPTVAYVGAANGGLWKTTDFFQTYTPLFDDQNTQSIGSIAIDPRHPDTIYCGTGEPNSLRSYYPGTGLYRSSDAGMTWELIGLDSSYSIAAIAVHPTNSNVVFAAALGSLRKATDERGVYRTTDYGETWERVLYGSDVAGAIDVDLNPRNPDTVYAALWERLRREDYMYYGGDESGLYRSTDGGDTWAPSANGFPTESADLGRIDMDVCRDQPEAIYALTAYASGHARGLYGSFDGGDSWELIDEDNAHSSSYAWFNRICRVNPTDTSDVFIGGMSMYRSAVYYGFFTFSASGQSHVDQHAVAFAPSNPDYIAIGNDGGVDYTTDGGAFWQESAALPVTQFYVGDVSPHNHEDMMGGTQDNGTVRSRVNAAPKTNGLVWDAIYGGDGFYCLYDYEDPNRMYACSQYGGLGRSTNGGEFFGGATSGLDKTHVNWMMPLVMDKNDPLTLYTGTYRVYRSINGAASWTAISGDMANGHPGIMGTITTIDVAKSDPDVIYCGTDDANVWVTKNGGESWTKISDALPERWVTRVTIDRDSANVCYVTLSGYKIDEPGSHLYRTSDYGATWTSLGNGLSDAPLSDVLVDPLDPNTLYVASDAGVWTTSYPSGSWSLLAEGMPPASPVQDITIDSASRKLVAWTHGRGAWQVYLPIPSGLEPDGGDVAEAFALRQNYPNPFNPTTTISFDAPRETTATLDVWNATGERVAVLIDGKTTSAGTHRVRFDASGLASGVYYYRLTADGASETRKMTLLR